MEDNGYPVQIEDVQNLNTVKGQNQVPSQLQSCHTAIVDGYIIEGHVSVTEIERLLDERPDIVGLAVPGMPVGSPGMEGPRSDPYDVLAFRADGRYAVYQHYHGGSK